jgi:hypothetical protein
MMHVILHYPYCNDMHRSLTILRSDRRHIFSARVLDALFEDLDKMNNGRVLGFVCQ